MLTKPRCLYIVVKHLGFNYPPLPSMKLLTLILCNCLCCALSSAQNNQSTSTLNVLDPEGAKSIHITFPCAHISPENSDGKVFIIEMHIKANLPRNILEALAKAGRYNLEGIKKDDQYLIVAPQLSNSVTIQGVELKEKISLYIETPGLYILDKQLLFRDVSAFNYRNAGVTRSNPAERMKQIKEKVEIAPVKINCEGLECEGIKLKKGDVLVDGKVLEWKE